MGKAADAFARFQKHIGNEEGVGEWMQIDQSRIDDFADTTLDHQFIHVDPEKAAKLSPYKVTIAHGFLTLSLLPYLTQSNHPDFFANNYPGMRLRVNYGLNKVRYPAPVLCGSRIRARTAVQSVEEVDKGVQIIYLLTIDIDGGSKPACVAEQIMRVYP
jgi:acyl dehydratase